MVIYHNSLFIMVIKNISASFVSVSLLVTVSEIYQQIVKNTYIFLTKNTYTYLQEELFNFI